MAVGAWIDTFLLSYAQVFFSRSRLVGALLLAATMLAPRLGIAGLLAVAVAAGTAKVVRLSPDLLAEGMYGYNALLVGLGCAAMLELSPMAAALALLGVVGTVLVTAALHAWLTSGQSIPVLTLPFLVVFSVLLAAAAPLGVQTLTFPGSVTPLVSLAAPGLAGDLLRAVGTVFFCPDAAVGLVMVTALVVYSRIAAGLGIAALLGATLLARHLGLPEVSGWELGFNTLFAAVALGGVWFVPGLWAVALAALGAALVGLVTLGATPLAHFLGFPVLVWPLNLVLIGLLLAMRQRVRDGRPKAVDFVPGTPEQNQDYYLTRVARFGSQYAARLHAPFRGRWVCTQGVDGAHTHRGPWRHGLDFEVRGADGSTFRGSGERREDYHCYRLPVLATADGTVARIIDGIPDNDVGASDMDNRWGNVVVLYHGSGLCSLVAHLAPGSVKVREGQFVRQGTVLGQCGSSGRSPVPHLHFQLQATAVVGAPTIEVELHDVVTETGDGACLRSTLVPAEGQVVRNLDPRAEVRQLLGLSIDTPLVFRVGEREESLQPTVELLGQTTLRSAGATLFYDAQDPLLVVYDVVGRGRAVLHLLRAALGRLPYEPAGHLAWTDRLPARHVLPWTARLGLAFRPTALREGIEMRYRAEQDGADLVVVGVSAEEPAVSTRAVLRRGAGITEISVTARGRTIRAERAPKELTCDP